MGQGVTIEKNRSKHLINEDVSISHSRKTLEDLQSHELAYNATSLHRGLVNAVGENNCFLNVTVQALWHLGPFRMGFQNLIAQSDRNHKSLDKIVDAICNLFVNYEYADSSVIPATELRQKLSLISSRFELGSIADANEVLDTILARIHDDTMPSCPDSNNGKCLSHTVFGGVLLEQSICRLCGETSEPILRNDYAYCIYAMEVISTAADLSIDQRILSPHETVASVENNRSKSSSRFGKLLSKCLSVGAKSCPSLLDIRQSTQSRSSSTVNNSNESYGYQMACKGQANVKRYCLEAPLALAISVVWTQGKESAEVLKNFLDLISNVIHLSDLFDIDASTQFNSLPYLSRPSTSTSSPTANSSSYFSDYNDVPYMSHSRSRSAILSIPEKVNSEKLSYLFRGLVCYYGLHYVSIFQEYSPETGNRFLLFDDQKVRVIGDWNDVKTECLKSRYQPVLLLYELVKPASKAKPTQKYEQQSDRDGYTDFDELNDAWVSVMISSAEPCYRAGCVDTGHGNNTNADFRRFTHVAVEEDMVDLRMLSSSSSDSSAWEILDSSKNSTSDSLK